MVLLINSAIFGQVLGVWMIHIFFCFFFVSLLISVGFLTSTACALFFHQDSRSAAYSKSPSLPRKGAFPIHSPLVLCTSHTFSCSFFSSQSFDQGLHPVLSIALGRVLTLSYCVWIYHCLSLLGSYPLFCSVAAWLPNIMCSENESAEFVCFFHYLYIIEIFNSLGVLIMP